MLTLNVRVSPMLYGLLPNCIVPVARVTSQEGDKITIELDVQPRVNYENALCAGVIAVGKNQRAMRVGNERRKP